MIARCGYSEETAHGAVEVEIVGGFCKKGEGCLEKCPHSFGEDRLLEAMEAFSADFGAPDAAGADSGRSIRG